MSKPTLTELKSRADDVYATYASNFAGKPRATRNLDLLNEIIATLSAIVEEARDLMNGSRNPAMLTFIESANENLARYRDEQAMIQQAKETPFAADGALLAARANRAFDVYARHFAGHDRATRDRQLIHELVEELEELGQRIQALIDRGATQAQGDLDTVRTQLDLYRAEETNIARSQSAGTQEELANRLAQLANDQFGLYRDHFAGKSRGTRRPALLERMIANLEEYRAEMEELQEDGFDSATNRNNIKTIDQNLELYRAEVVEIRKSQTEMSAKDHAGALGGAANDVFALYGEHFAGKERRTRDLALAGLLCDSLRDIALQMRAIADVEQIDMNDRNLEIVEERWATYEAEYKAIRDAKGA